LAEQIQNLLGGFDLKSKLVHSRALTTGIYLSLDHVSRGGYSSGLHIHAYILGQKVNMKIGSALASLHDKGILIMGPGYSFHNMQSFFNLSQLTVQASVAFNQWLKDTILRDNSDYLE
jgi:4,5-DOPA dioxygenase extradiol